MAFTEIYVDPSLASNTGAGTIGDPYGDVQHALNTASMPASGGCRLNIKAGVDEVLSAVLSFTNFFSVNNTTSTNPLFIQGYTAAAGDGGKGGISGNGSVSVINEPSLDHAHVRDMHLHNVGNNRVIKLDDFCSLVNCEVDNANPGNDAINMDNQSVCAYNYIHNIGRNAINVFGHTFGNYIVDDYIAGMFGAAINGDSNRGFIRNNVIWLDTPGVDGIQFGQGATVAYNTIFNNAAGTGAAITPIGAGRNGGAILNNVIEGFNGAGGAAIALEWQAYVSGNIYFDCTNGLVDSDQYPDIAADLPLTLLSSTPFIDGPGKNLQLVSALRDTALPGVVGNF